MYYVYILKSIKFPQEIYTGFTEDIQQRLQSHNEGANKHTSKFKPWKLIWVCGFSSEEKAKNKDLFNTCKICLLNLSLL